MGAWRILWMTYRVRVDPNPSPTVAFSPLKISVLERGAATQKRTRPTGQPLTLQDAIRAMAQLGGFLGGKSNGVPGVKTLWRGHPSMAIAVLVGRGVPEPFLKCELWPHPCESRRAFRMPGNLGTPGF